MSGIQSSILTQNIMFPTYGGQLGCISGYIYNPSDADTATIIIRGVNNTGKITRNIDPFGYLVFRALEFESIMSTGPDNLIIVYSDNIDFALNESQAMLQVGNPIGFPLQTRYLTLTDNPDTSINQVNAYKTDLGSNQLGGSPTALTTDVNTKFPHPVSMDANGNLGLLKTANTNGGFAGTIATTGTAQQFTTTSTVVQHFQIRNTSTTGNVQYVGSSGAQSLLLYPNGMFLWDANPNEQTDISAWEPAGRAYDPPEPDATSVPST